MSWKFIPSDNYNLDDLLDFKEFFIKDLNNAKNSIVKSLSYQKFGLPNWRLNHLRVKMALEEAEKNLVAIEHAIYAQRKKERL